MPLEICNIHIILVYVILILISGTSAKNIIKTPLLVHQFYITTIDFGIEQHCSKEQTPA